jgi:hypothetical protein
MKYKKIATMVLMCLMCTAVQAGNAFCPPANSFCTPNITEKTQGPVRTNTESDSIHDEEDLVIPETFDIERNIERNNERNNTIFYPAVHNAVLPPPEKPFTSMYSDSDSEADEPDYLA